MTRLIPALALLLAACQAQSMRFSDAEPVMVDVEGWRIAVWQTDEEVQAIRMNFIYGAAPAEMMAYGRRAIRQATGCNLRPSDARANASVLTGRKACPEQP